MATVPKSAAMFRRTPALLCLIALIAFALPARAAGVELVYELHAGGFEIGRLRATLMVAEGGGYRLTSRLDTTGFVGWMTGFVSDAASDGRLRDGGAAPALHSVDNVWRGRTRWVRAAYGSDAPAFRVFPEAAADDRPPVPPELTRGSLDPLSGALSLAMAAGDAAPGRVIPVYDGRRRYDLVVASVSPATVNEPLHQGPGLRMEVTWKRVAGYAKPPPFMPSNFSDGGTVWFAPPRPETLGLPLPLRVVADSPFGAGIVRLLSLRPLP